MASDDPFAAQLRQRQLAQRQQEIAAGNQAAAASATAAAAMAQAREFYAGYIKFVRQAHDGLKASGKLRPRTFPGMATASPRQTGYILEERKWTCQTTKDPDDPAIYAYWIKCWEAQFLAPTYFGSIYDAVRLARARRMRIGVDPMEASLAYVADAESLAWYQETLLATAEDLRTRLLRLGVSV